MDCPGQGMDPCLEQAIHVEVDIYMLFCCCFVVLFFCIWNAQWSTYVIKFDELNPPILTPTPSKPTRTTHLQVSPADDPSHNHLLQKLHQLTADTG